MPASNPPSSLKGHRTHNVLIAGIAGASLGTELAKCLRLSPKYRAYGCDISALAYGHVAKEFHQTFTVDPEHYLNEVLAVCAQNDIAFIVPGGEKPMAILSRAADTLADAGVTYLGNAPGVVATLSDKRATTRLLDSLGFEVPLTREVIAESDLDGFPFPCIVKPATGAGGSDSVFLAADRDECGGYLDMLRGDGRTIIVQEYIPLTEGEYTIGVLSLPTTQVVSCVCMKRVFTSKLSIAHRSKCGLISSGYSQGLIEKNPGLEAQARAIAERVGSTGPINIQARVRDGRLLPFEINPRFSASAYLRAMAGVNELVAYLDYLTDGTITAPQGLKAGYYLRSFTESFVPLSRT